MSVVCFRHSSTGAGRPCACLFSLVVGMVVVVVGVVLWLVLWGNGEYMEDGKSEGRVEAATPPGCGVNRMTVLCAVLVEWEQNGGGGVSFWRWQARYGAGVLMWQILMLLVLLLI